MKNRMVPAAFLFLLIACISLDAEDSGFQVSGSVRNETGYIGLRDDIAGASRNWYSATSVDVRLSREGENTRFLALLWTEYDSADGDWELSLDESWFEWRPAAFLGARLGRAPLRFGSCIAFNPANSLAATDIFDSRSNEVGFDGFFLELHPLPQYSLAAHAAFLLPGDSVQEYDLSESSAHGRITFLAPGAGILGPVEIGVSGDFRRLGGTAPDGKIPMAGGVWLSMDIAGFVLGAEGTLRSAGYEALAAPGVTVMPGGSDAAEYGWAVSLNRRAGDFFAVLETSYSKAGDGWKGFAQLSRSTEDTGQSLQAMIDFDALAARTSLDAAWNLSDFLVVHGWGAWNYQPEKWNPELPADWAAGLALECFF